MGYIASKHRFSINKPKFPLIGLLVSAIVEFDYTACELDELNLAKGAVITNIKVQPGGWWHGTVASTGKSGMFPDNFVKLFDQQQHNDDKVILR